MADLSKLLPGNFGGKGMPAPPPKGAKSAPPNGKAPPKGKGAKAPPFKKKSGRGK